MNLNTDGASPGGANTAQVVTAATAFLAALDDTQRGKVQYDLSNNIVVALVMPSLIVLSRSHIYPAVRTGLAGVGVVLAAGWLAERTTLIQANPFERLSTALVAHPFTVPATLALTAAATLALNCCAPARKALRLDAARGNRSRQLR